MPVRTSRLSLPQNFVGQPQSGRLGRSWFLMSPIPEMLKRIRIGGHQPYPIHKVFPFAGLRALPPSLREEGIKIGDIGLIHDGCIESDV